ncbi:hypothetical protein [Streptomyces albogriseolus]|uniref:hypothetical protein n=1 Tax=Streptomyces albogriseolus TaxID=1887 RepID=UPI0038098623
MELTDGLSDACRGAVVMAPAVETGQGGSSVVNAIATAMTKARLVVQLEHSIRVLPCLRNLEHRRRPEALPA